MSRDLDVYVTKAQAKTQAVPASDVPGLPIFTHFGAITATASPPWRILRSQAGVYSEVHTTLLSSGLSVTTYSIYVNGAFVDDVTIAASVIAQTDTIEIAVEAGDILYIEVDAAGTDASDMTVQFEIAGVCAAPYTAIEEPPAS